MKTIQVFGPQDHRTPEQVRLEKQVLEYTTLVIDPQDNIGLLGYQPRLRKIRQAWQDQDLSFKDLTVVLTSLAKELDGESEPFKDKDHFARYAWGDLLKKYHDRQEEPKPALSQAEQAAIIQSVMGDKKKKKRSSAPKQPKKVEIDVNALPAHLRKFAK
jgi:hypothetical protein